MDCLLRATAEPPAAAPLPAAPPGALPSAGCSATAAGGGGGCALCASCFASTAATAAAACAWSACFWLRHAAKSDAWWGKGRDVGQM